jgi:hypothetical protein
MAGLTMLSVPSFAIAGLSVMTSGGAEQDGCGCRPNAKRRHPSIERVHSGHRDVSSSRPALDGAYRSTNAFNAASGSSPEAIVRSNKL